VIQKICESISVNLAFFQIQSPSLMGLHFHSINCYTTFGGKAPDLKAALVPPLKYP
jgi:hypothetical protein